MRTKIKKVFYCDFCKKHSLKSLIIHEKHCTANPNRECRLCGRKDINKIIPNYKIEIKQEWFKKPHTIEGIVMDKIKKMVIEKIEQLRNEVNECPVCISTVIRCNKYHWPIVPQYDFKENLKLWWNKINDEKYEKYEDY